jgi:hypothetical protein
MSPTAELETTHPGTGGDAASDSFGLAVFAHLDEPSELTEVLTANAGLHPDDAMRAARLTPGLLPIRLPEEVAREVVRQLEGRGIHAVAVATAELPALDHAITVHHLNYDSQGFEPLDLHGAPRRLVSWRDLALLSVGSVPMEDGQRSPAEPQVVLHAAPNLHLAVNETTVRHGLVLWVVCERPCQIYRFMHNQMGYEHLGARKTTSMWQNFTLFAEDLARHAPHAYLTPATRAFLHHGMRRHFEFHSTRELRDYTVFHLLARQQVAAAPAAQAVSAAAAPAASTQGEPRLLPARGGIAMSTLNREQIHADHRSWESDIPMWQEDLEQWRREQARLFNELESALGARFRALKAHSQAINSHEATVREHEQFIAGRQHSGSSQLGEIEARLASTHERGRARHEQLRRIHEALKRNHHRAMASLAVASKILKKECQAPGGTDERMKGPPATRKGIEK